jgi:hypothetical protein
LLAFALAVVIRKRKRKRASKDDMNSLGSGDNGDNDDNDDTSNDSFDADVFSSQRDKMIFSTILSDLAHMDNKAETLSFDPNCNPDASITSNNTITSHNDKGISNDIDFDINDQSTIHDTGDSQNTFSQGLNEHSRDK